MNNIKNAFNIKDLENLSGIKAHTIRIWEKRYKILAPMRTDTNIRIYDGHSLQKLLNIKALNSFGYKISTIAKLPEERIPVMVKEILNSKTLKSQVISNFKMAMMNFDQQLFFTTYNTLLAEKSFKDIFREYFMPLLDEIGMLWQTDTITPAHEHFISALIKQKIATNTEKLQMQPPLKTDRVYVLYLPEGEVHEIGLMLLNYELMFAGYQTVYIGESVPMSCVKDMKNYFKNITYVTYVTVEPSAGDINNYVAGMKNEVINDEDTMLCIFGNNSKNISSALLNEKIKVFGSINEFAENL